MRDAVTEDNLCEECARGADASEDVTPSSLLPPEVCGVCNLSVPGGTLEVHMADRHVCPYCEGDFEDKAEHIRQEHLRCPFCSKGYVDEALNRDLFFPEGWLNTGDLGRFDEDGFIWITGRV